MEKPAASTSTEERRTVPLGAKLCYLVAALSGAALIIDLAVNDRFDSRMLVGGIFLAMGMGLHFRKDKAGA
jgi:hypothetical protein